MLPQLIRLLRNINYNVVATNFDQSAVNRKCYSLLGVNTETPYFLVDDVKVWALFDVPHLIKSARTTFMDHSMESLDGKVSGEIIRKCYNKDKMTTTKTFPKLTDAHLYYDTFQKMRVNLAVQLLSESVASGLESMTSVGVLKQDDKVVKATIGFVRNFNVLFDLLNASSVDDPNPNKQGLSSKNIHRLEGLLIYVASLKKLDSGTVYWIDGLIQTINGIIGIFHQINSNDKEFILFTRYFNQDPLENLFGLIRAHGGNNRNPYLIDFLRIISRIMTSKLLLNPQNTNCAIEDTSAITVLDLQKYENEKDNTKVQIFNETFNF